MSDENKKTQKSAHEGKGKVMTKAEKAEAKAAKRAKDAALPENSQVRRVNNMVKKSIIAVVVAVILVPIFMIVCILNATGQSTRLAAVNACSDYQLAQKELTIAAQSLGVTGNAKYREAYNQELQVNKRRDAAISILEGLNISSEERSRLDNLKVLQESTQPLEQEAIGYVDNGELAKSIEIMFSDEYEKLITEIDAEAAGISASIAGRMNTQVTVLLVLMWAIWFIFIFIFIYIILLAFGLIKFTRKDLLEPITIISDDMDLFASGNISTILPLEPDESEVGRMVGSIKHMKNSLRAIIREISATLEQMGDGNYNIDPPEAVMDSGASSVRTVEAVQLYGDPLHAVAVLANGAVLDLEQEQPAAMSVGWRSHPVAVSPLMGERVQRVVWHLSGEDLQLTLRVTGQRGIMASEWPVSVMAVDGDISQPLAAAPMRIAARTLCFAAEGTAPTGTMFMKTLIYCR